MTLGFVLIFVGAQLCLVETYVFTPRFSNFLADNAPAVAQSGQQLPTANNTNYNSPYYQASYPTGTTSKNPLSVLNGPANGPRAVSPPRWVSWPVLFMGTVVFLHGFSRRRD
jgi:hypothetical protein